MNIEFITIPGNDIIAEFVTGYLPRANEQWLEFVNDTGFNWSQKSYRFSDLKQPVVNISWFDSLIFCQWLTTKTGEIHRLPTEAEWEYACRAGTTTEYSFGDDAALLDEYAWYAKNSGGQTQSVGAKKPNPWGLHDMHGNVWEWCQDRSNQPVSSAHVLRGGSWLNQATNTRSAIRNNRRPTDSNVDAGFRVAKSITRKL